MDNWLVKARKASQLTPESCACELSCSTADYLFLEAHPGEVTLNELNSLRRVFNDESQRIVWAWLREFEPR